MWRHPSLGFSDSQSAQKGLFVLLPPLPFVPSKEGPFVLFFLRLINSKELRTTATPFPLVQCEKVFPFPRFKLRWIAGHSQLLGDRGEKGPSFSAHLSVFNS